MGNRRFALVPSSDDEDDAPPPPPPPPSRRRSSTADEEPRSQRKRKQVKLSDDEDEVEEEERETKKKRIKKKEEEKSPPKIEEDEEEEGEEEEEEEEEVQEEAKPVGDVVRVSGKGRWKRNHYLAFEFDGLHYDLEDPVLLSPEVENQKPYVAIIKDISETKGGTIMVTGQWFYRPEEAEKKGGANWQSNDTRELFYSFHRDEIPAESVMHKCVVHFIPKNKQIPPRKQHPGFIVQKVYDTDLKRLFKLTDKDYEDNKQHEIDLLVQKTMSRLGDLPDIDTEDAAANQEDQLRNKRLLRRENMSPLDVSRDDDATNKSAQPSSRAETPGSCATNASEYHNILAKFNALTGETSRDKVLERLLQGVQFICSTTEGNVGDSKQGEPTHVSEPANGSQEKGQNSGATFIWPDDAVPAISALEKVAHETLFSDFTKYNQKMRQLSFNVKGNALLAQRLVNRELEPSQILSMTPNELKAGRTAEEIATNEPEESARMQMTDARCKRCSEKKVGLVDIIQAGHGDRYQLECTACGNIWFSSRDEAAELTIDGPSSAKNVGTAPLATSKFEDVEKKLVSPREPNEALKKATEPFVPILETQKSFNKSSKTEDEKKLVSPREPSSAKEAEKKLDTQKSFNKPKTENKDREKEKDKSTEN